MARIEKSVLIGYSAAQMFALVEKVEDYPKFLPWCRATDVHWRKPDGMRASITVDFKALQQTFTTENRHVPNALIEMRLVEGPFRNFNGCWHFQPLSDTACKIEFSLDYEFSNAVLEQLAGPVFGSIARTLVDSFVSRAEVVYG
ncbi:MAG: type II toxin-antitoxin system RatA family toxin [Burkholderiaceae bacterium]|nr:MAG: type II toxin-antitoxin system RatA family toxin [Burkholderiaceae bacterium]